MLRLVRGKLQVKSLQIAFTCAGTIIELYLLKCQYPKENENKERQRKEGKKGEKKEKEMKRKK